MRNNQHPIQFRNALAIAAVAVGLFTGASLPAAAQDANCTVVGAISHRCYTFQSDATWREGLSTYHGSNGG
jgi:nicotinic acid phosphoribosyltransferase